MGIRERKKREKKQRQKAIIDAAEKVFFSKGFDTATMDDVAEQSELSKGTLYLYFKNKGDLYLAIILRGLEILTEKFAAAVKTPHTGIDKVHAIGQAYISFYRTHPDYFQAMSSWEPHTRDINQDSAYALACLNQGDKTLEILAEALQKGIDDGSIRPDLSPAKTAVILWGQTTGILQLISSKEKHMKDKFKQYGYKSPQDIIDYAFDLTRQLLEIKR